MRCGSEGTQRLLHYIMIDIKALKNSGKVLVDDYHLWGYQLRFVNTEKYCGKFLVLENSTPGSLHYHKIKKETFIVLKGKVYLVGYEHRKHDEYYQDEAPLFCNQYGVGETITIPEWCIHQMQLVINPDVDFAKQYAVILEVSTHDDDSDTYRVQEAEK